MDKSMDKIVALCRRRGFIFQSSEIYGGIQGFWDYGPLGAELKRNVREAWYGDMVTRHDELTAPPGAPRPFQMVGVETTIIMHPQVWRCSGHYDLFHDMMVDCRGCKARFRADHLRVVAGVGADGRPVACETVSGDAEGLSKSKSARLEKAVRRYNAENAEGDEPAEPTLATYALTEYSRHLVELGLTFVPDALNPVCPECGGALTEPREFNLMFESWTGAVRDETSRVFLRPETAQGMFVNFKNVLDSSRVKLPYGIAQIGKSFRNEITPRNFTFRSREFEQMEMEFFCRPSESRDWYQYWRDRRYRWYIDLGIAPESLVLREHAAEELSHYSVGTADVEYAFPFLAPGEFGELEGIAHRGDFDLRSHMEGKLVKDDQGCLVPQRGPDGQPRYKGSGKDLTYFDDQSRERFVPHVIEPAAGADRATLAFLCEAYFEDQQPDEKGQLQARTVMRFHPRLAPIKAAVFPLIKREGMPEQAAALYRALKAAGVACQYDEQGAIGRRYRRQDEIGTPFCITVDGETAQDGCVTVRDRDTLAQDRVPVREVVAEVQRRLRG